MRIIPIVFTKSKKPLPLGSWLIRLWTKKSFSHVARKLTLYGDIELYYQANEGKVNYENKEIFDTKHEIVLEYKLEVSDGVYRNVSRECVKEAGKKYGLMQNLGIVLVDILKIIKVNTKNPWQDGKNCSELIFTNVLKILDPNLSNDPNKIKPHEIENIIKLHFKLCTDGIWRHN